MTGLRRRRRAAAALFAVAGLAAMAVAAGLLPRATVQPEGDGLGSGHPMSPRPDPMTAEPDPDLAEPDHLATPSHPAVAPGILRLGAANAVAPAPAAYTPNPSALAPATTPRTHASPAPPQYPREWHEFYFTRAAYSSYGRGWGGRGNSWAIDYPKADIQFLTVLKRLTNLDAYDDENAVLLTDPRIRNFPFLYALEVGYMSLSEAEVEGLRDYLLAGGFLVIDDFWGSQEWAQFEFQMKLVFPGREIIDLDPSHTVFNTFYEIDEILQVPAYGRYWGGRTYERDGYVPYVKGIEDDDGRLMVIINWNTDLGDAWEWAEQPDYPVPYSTFAFQMGVNMIVYAMTH